jgi:hypothetical protein
MAESKDRAAAGSPAAAATPPRSGGGRQTMLPKRPARRSLFESVFVRIVATCGVVAIGVAIAAIMVSSNSKGWLVGLVVSIVTCVLAAVLWSSRQL